MSGEQLLVIDDSPTVLKVIEAALVKLGYRIAAAAGATAGLTLARELETTPALVLLDAAMSDKDGAACCQDLAAIPRLSAVPIVLMVPKGGDPEERLARATGVVDYITKPFSPDAIGALVSRLLGGAPPDPDPAGSPQASAQAATSAHAHAHAHDGADASAAATAAVRASAEQASAAFEAMRHEMAQRIESYRQESSKWDLADLVHGAFDDATLERLLTTYDVRRGGARAGGQALAGDLAAITIGEVLSWLQEKSLTGCLRMVHGDAQVELYLRRGRVDFAAAIGVGVDLLLGRFAVEEGSLTPESLTAVLDDRARATSKPKLFGADLITRGLLTHTQLQQAMARQSGEVVYETLRWTQGRFWFQTMAAAAFPDVARSAALGLSIDSLLLEGFRRVDEWRVIERDIDDFDLIFVPNESKLAGVARGQLTGDEIAVLEFVNGHTAVKDIIRTLRLGSFDVSKILFRLLRAGLIRRRVAPTVA
jgi:CheY-like chemotaxis protein